MKSKGRVFSDPVSHAARIDRLIQYADNLDEEDDKAAITKTLADEVIRLRAKLASAKTSLEFYACDETWELAFAKNDDCAIFGRKAVTGLHAKNALKEIEE